MTNKKYVSMQKAPNPFAGLKVDTPEIRAEVTEKAKRLKECKDSLKKMMAELDNSIEANRKMLNDKTDELHKLLQEYEQYFIIEREL